MLEASGIKDILAKSLGSSNRTNIAKATILALSQLKEPNEQLARRKPTPNETDEKRNFPAEIEAEGGKGVV